MIFWIACAVLLFGTLYFAYASKDNDFGESYFMAIMGGLMVGVLMLLVLAVVGEIIHKKYNWESIEQVTISETAVVDASDNTITFTADGEKTTVKLKHVELHEAQIPVAVRTDKEARYPLVWPFGAVSEKPTKWELTFPEDGVRLKL
jgi:uncharacterized membrane protein